MAMAAAAHSIMKRNKLSPLVRAFNASNDSNKSAAEKASEKLQDIKENVTSEKVVDAAKEALENGEKGGGGGGLVKKGFSAITGYIAGTNPIKRMAFSLGKGMVKQAIDHVLDDSRPTTRVHIKQENEILVSFPVNLLGEEHIQLHISADNVLHVTAESKELGVSYSPRFKLPNEGNFEKARYHTYVHTGNVFVHIKGFQRVAVLKIDVPCDNEPGRCD